MHRQFHKISNNIGFIIIGFVGLGGFIGAIDDVESQLSPRSGLILSILIISIWLGVEFFIRKKPIKWFGKNMTKTKVKRLKNRNRYPLIGAILLLCIPAIKKSFSTDEVKPSAVCIKPFSKEEKFRVLILPFYKNGTEIKGDYGAEVEPIIREIIRENKLGIEVYYFNNYPENLSYDSIGINKLMACNEADVVVHGRHWYSNDSEQGSISVKYELNDSTINFNIFNSIDSPKLYRKKLPQVGSMAEIERLFFSRELKDIKEVEQLVFWLGALDCFSRQEFEQSLHFIDLAISYGDAENAFYYFKSMLEVALQKHEEALETISGISDLKTNQAARFIRFMIYSISNDYKNISQEYRWLEGNFKNIEYLRFVRTIYLFKLMEFREEKKALSVINDIVTTDSTNIFNRYLRALITLENGTIDLDYILNRDSFHVDANYLKALFFHNRGDFATSLKFVDKAIEGRLDKKEVEKKLELQLSDTFMFEINTEEFYNLRALNLFHVGEYNKALEDINTAIAINESKSPEYFCNKATISFAVNKDIDESLVLCNKALEIDSTFFLAYQVLAKNYSDMRDLSNAVKYTDKALNLSPDDPIVLLEASRHHLNNGDVVKARKYVDLSIKLGMDNLSTNHILGACYLHEGDLPKAGTYLRKAKQQLRNSNNKEELNPLYQCLGKYYLLVDSIYYSISLNDELLANSTDENLVENKLLYMHLIGDYQGVLEFTHGYLESENGNQDLIKSMRSFYLPLAAVLGCFDGAKGLSKTLLDNPNSIKVLAFRANIYACKKQNELAEKDISKILTLNSKLDGDYGILLYRAKALVELNKNHFEEALKSIGKSISIGESYKEGVGVFSTRLKNMKNPQRVNVFLIESYFTQIDIYLGKNDFSQARKTLNKIKRISKDHSKILAYETIIERSVSS